MGQLTSVILKVIFIYNKYDFKLHQTGFQSTQMLKRNQDSVDLYFEMCELAPSSTANQFMNPYPTQPVYGILL